jgi:SAM-dependent methyltransferase
MLKSSLLDQTAGPLELSNTNASRQSDNSLGQCPGCGSEGANIWLQAPDKFHGRSQLYDLVRCPECSLVWLHNPLPPCEMSAHYGVDYDRAIASGGADPEHWKLRREELLQYKSGGAILDLGCSTGGFLASLKGPSWELFGIEMSETVAKTAEARTGAQVFVGDILDATFPPGSFDAITCFNVFEHVYQPKEVLEKVYQWLKPGGVFYTMMPNIDSAGARIFRSYWYALELPRHLYHFSPKSLTRIASSVGFQELSITTHRELYAEASAHYVVDDILKKAGICRTPLAQARPASLPWRVIRKGFRLSVLPLLTLMASFAGEGETIRAVLRRPTSQER